MAEGLLLSVEQAIERLLDPLYGVVLRIDNCAASHGLARISRLACAKLNPT